MRARWTLAGMLLVVAAAPAAAQQSIQQEMRASQLKLDSIQNERARLQREMESLQSRVRDASRELLNIEKQRETSRSALLELEFQTHLLNENVERTTQEHEHTTARLRERSVDRDDRLRSIYKRGPLHSVQVMLTAQSFGDLMSRYKYLHLMALYDRMIVDDVARLERQLRDQEQELRESLRQLASLRDDKAGEVAQLERVERQRQTTLRNFRQQETRTATRLTELEREQTRLNSTIENLERRRREEEARRATPSEPGSITTRSLGTLAWPVDGTVLYRFGPDRKPDGIVLRNQGIGIGATAGSPVKAVGAGTVEVASVQPGYGLSVFISHGGGYRTLYLHLKTVNVVVNQQVTAGQVIGTVGGEQSPEGPHIEFQVRVGVEAVDPLAWLRARAGGL